MATDLRPQSGFLGPSYPIPKPTRKPFQIHFISSAIVIVLSEIPCPQVKWGADCPLLKSQACQAFLPCYFPPGTAGSRLCLAWSTPGAAAQLLSLELTSARERGSPARPLVPGTAGPGSLQPTWAGDSSWNLRGFGTGWSSGSFGNWLCHPLLCCISSAPSLGAVGVRKAEQELQSLSFVASP